MLTLPARRKVARLLTNLKNGDKGSANFSHSTYTDMISEGFAVFNEMTIKRDAGYTITSKGLQLIVEMGI